jgi:hypothetical protein
VFRSSSASTAIGVILALIMGRVLTSLIYEISPADPLTLLWLDSTMISIAVFAWLHPRSKVTKTIP